MMHVIILDIRILLLFISFKFIYTQSEIFMVIFRVSTNTATYCILFSVRRMWYLQWTFLRTWAFWKLVFAFSRNIISWTLLFMTGLTKMGVTPAKPLSHRAAEFAFKLYKISSMFFTIFNSSTDTYSRAFSADKLFFFKILITILPSFTIFHPSEIRFWTFEALIIRQFVQGIAL